MKSLSQSCCYLTQSLPETKRLKAIGVKGYLFPIIYSKMQRGKVVVQGQGHAPHRISSKDICFTCSFIFTLKCFLNIYIKKKS